jgi:DNA-binding transcriptional LysR family regulator
MQSVTQINLDAIRSFAVFSETMNFCTAATQLNISQPALHVKIRKLAEQLELPLYRRIGRGLELTVHGQTIARHGRRLAGIMSACVQELHGLSGGEPLVLAAGSGAFQYFLGPAIARFLSAALAPLSLLTLNRGQAIEAVRSGKAHLAVAPLAVIPGDLTTTLLTQVGQVLAVPATHHLASSRCVTLQELDGCPLVVPPVGAPHREALSGMLLAAGVEWRCAVEASGWDLMLQFVRMGVGVAVVNAYCTLPAGVVGIPLPELPVLNFYACRLRGQCLGSELSFIEALLIEHADAWQRG